MIESVAIGILGGIIGAPIGILIADALWYAHKRLRRVIEGSA